LLYAWRQKLVAALMHECVLIPEGVSDVAWLEALQTALELHQGWHAAGDGAPLLSTFVGVVPTIDAKIADTFVLVSAVHARPSILVDGDIRAALSTLQTRQWTRNNGATFGPYRQPRAFAQVALQRHHARTEPLHCYCAGSGTPERAAVRAFLKVETIARTHAIISGCAQRTALSRSMNASRSLFD
jgi:hypothetical protein